MNKIIYILVAVIMLGFLVYDIINQNFNIFWIIVYVFGITLCVISIVDNKK